MIDKDAVKLVYKYAKKFAKNENDIDDIVQEAFLLFIKNPIENKLPKKFYFTLVRRGAYQFYFKQIRKNNTVELKNKDVLFESNDEQKFQLNSIIDDSDFEKQYMYYEIKSNFKHITGISNKESELLLKILNGYEPEYEDRTHFNNLRKKLVAFFN